MSHHPRRFRLLPLALGACLALILPACGSGGRPRTLPPPDRTETQPQAPAPTHVWLPGHWQWRRDTWVWISGYWTPRPSPEAQWVPGHYIPAGKYYQWVPGHWK